VNTSLPSFPSEKQIPGLLHEVLDRETVEAVERWGLVWGDHTLSWTVAVTFSTRLRTTMGRAMIIGGRDASIVCRTSRIILHDSLRSAARSKLRDVLCHELAHIVAWRRVAERGQRHPRPHGADWQQAMREVGHAPECTAGRRAKSASDVTAQKSRKASVVLHRCPVCQTMRTARKAVPQWRCAKCVAVGLDGHMDISRATPFV